MTSRLCFLAAISLGLIGCSPSKSDTSGSAATTSPSSSTASSDKDAKAPSDTSTPTAAGTKPNVTLPDSLKNEAYSYYGLGVDQPQKTELKIDGKSVTGEHTLTLQSVSGNVATYLETQTGPPEGDTNQTVSLSADGVYVESTTPYVLALPSKLDPGSSWTTHTVLSDGQTFTEDSTDKVVGAKSLQLKSGKVDTLYITGSGTGSLGSQKLTTSYQWWYAKGKGLIKTIQTINIGGKARTVETVVEG
jgi:hypothetical protein